MVQFPVLGPIVSLAMNELCALPSGVRWELLSNNPSKDKLIEYWSNNMQMWLQKLANSLTVIEMLHSSLHVSRKEFKSISHDGAIRHAKGRYRDPGNWTYSVVYLLLWNSVEGTSLKPLLVALAAKYTSLLPEAPYTLLTISMQGDVIECILASCREQGPAVEANYCADRIATNKYIKNLCEGVYLLRRIISDGEDLPLSALPPTAVFVKNIQSILCA